MNTKFTCNKPAKYRYTWPNRNEMYVCEEHARGIASIAAAIGMHLQFIMLAKDIENNLLCTQIVEKT